MLQIFYPTLSTFKLAGHIEVVEGGPDELQGLVEGVGVAGARVQNVDPWHVARGYTYTWLLAPTYRDVGQQRPVVVNPGKLKQL